MTPSAVDMGRTRLCVVTWKQTNLDLQDLIATKPLVVHVMIRLVGITAILVLDESESAESASQTQDGQRQ